jgi:aryl-alcohol dehydrogenase-like predicted oxidoreductase
MEYRRLGISDLTVSAVGFGCWPMGGTQYGPVEDADEVRAVQHALDQGITLFDTAAGYGQGHAEEVLGRALGRRRNEAIVVTKCGLVWDPEASRFRRDSTRANLMSEIDASLRRLGTEYVDLYLIHWPDPETPFAESMAALQEIVRAGKARHIGVSNFKAEQLRECRELAPLVADQVGYNLFDRRWEREVFPTCRELGVGVMAYGSLCHGLLTGAWTPGATFVDWDWRSKGSVFGQKLFEGENFLRNLEVVERLKEVARAKGTTLPCLALAWVLDNPAVSVALVGFRTPDEVDGSLRVTDLRLDASDRRRIDAIMQDAAGQTTEVPT